MLSKISLSMPWQLESERPRVDADGFDRYPPGSLPMTSDELSSFGREDLLRECQTKKDGSEAAFVIDTLGVSVSVLPGHSVQTHILMTDSFWTKTAETPHWNPFMAVSSSVGDAVTDADVNIISGAKAVRIHNRSSQSVTVYFRAKANTPGLILPTGTDHVLKEGQFGLKVDKLEFTFGGTVVSGLTVIQTFGTEQIGLGL